MGATAAIDEEEPERAPLDDAQAEEEEEEEDKESKCVHIYFVFQLEKYLAKR